MDKTIWWTCVIGSWCAISVVVHQCLLKPATGVEPRVEPAVKRVPRAHHYARDEWGKGGEYSVGDVVSPLVDMVAYHSPGMVAKWRVKVEAGTDGNFEDMAVSRGDGVRVRHGATCVVKSMRGGVVGVEFGQGVMYSAAEMFAVRR